MWTLSSKHADVEKYISYVALFSFRMLEFGLTCKKMSFSHVERHILHDIFVMEAIPHVDWSQTAYCQLLSFHFKVTPAFGLIENNKKNFRLIQGDESVRWASCCTVKLQEPGKAWGKEVETSWMKTFSRASKPDGSRAEQSNRANAWLKKKKKIHTMAHNILQWSIKHHSNRYIIL